LTPACWASASSACGSNPQWADVYLTRSACTSVCPITGVDGLDPRKAVRGMVVLGLEQELVDSQWPWKCTLCGNCEEACPMKVELVSIFRIVRGMHERDKVPGPIHKGVVMCLNQGNNLGIPKDDFLYLLEELDEEMDKDCCPGYQGSRGQGWG